MKICTILELLHEYKGANVIGIPRSLVHTQKKKHINTQVLLSQSLFLSHIHHPVKEEIFITTYLC
jgi:hypothetical protein